MKTLRTYSLNHFPVYHTAVLTILIMLYVTFLVLIYLMMEVCTFDYFSSNIPSPHSLPLGTATNLISFSLNLVGIFCFSWILLITENMQYEFVCQTYFTQHDAFKIHPQCHKWQDFLIIYGLITHTHTTFLYFFIHSSIACYLEAMVNNSAMNMGCRYLFELMFHSFWILSQRQNCWIMLQYYF